LKNVEKRNSSSVNEPAGHALSMDKAEMAPGQGLSFVVQKHFASHLHYDFRLEVDGVLKSWAIPKGPSVNPLDRRLAVMVEDHPLDYIDFQGVIADGNYGAGEVQIWDKGTYCAPGAFEKNTISEKIREGLLIGHITFVLDGTRLKGEFALIRIKKSDPKNWLLIKKNDEFAGTSDILV
jgi:bifunctional non-homologous end joining protein LigD